MRKIPIIVGPTASGKTDLSIKLAEKYKHEIINADSRQIYKFMDIGTAKPEKSQQTAIKHHLIDIIKPDEVFSAARFKTEAECVISSNPEKQFLIAGGAGLYIKAFLFGLFELETDYIVRENLKNFLNSVKNRDFPHLFLQKVDKVASMKIHKNDYFRINRALEVYFSTGIQISEHQKNHNFREKKYDYIKIGLYWERDELYQRIYERSVKMVKDGLLEETEKLLKMGFCMNLKSMQTIGYKEVSDYLQGEIQKSMLVEEIAKATRHYAKSQMTWFKGEKDIIWLHPEKEYQKIDSIIKTFLEV